MFCKEGPQFVKCKVLEVDQGVYSSMVIQDCETSKFIILTVFPNWAGEIPTKGSTGYIEFEFVEAGITKYFNKNLKENHIYQNTYFIFKQFVRETPKNQEDVTL